MSSHLPITLLLRLWRAETHEVSALNQEKVPDANARPLRITALDPHTGERWGYVTLPELLAFLQQQLEASKK